MQDMVHELEVIRKEIGEIKSLLLKIDEKLELQTPVLERAADSAENMDRHINFVEGIWSRIQNPFYTALSYVGGGAIEDR